MSSTVFIMGAGTSKCAGAPLMADFLDRAERLLQSDSVKEVADEFQQVFDAIGQLQAVHSKAQLDIKNVEAVLTTFEMAKTLGKFPGYNSEEIESLIKATKTLIFKTLENTIKFPINNKGKISPPTPHHDFADLLSRLLQEATPKQSVSIITFNYDILFDFALFFKGMSFNYGLDFDKNNDSIRLLKLHGSINWILNKPQNQILPWRLEDYFRDYSNEAWEKVSSVPIPIGSFLEKYEDLHLDFEPEPVLIPPTWNKAFYHEKLSSVWKQAALELSQAENIIVIGYSLPETDGFFRSLYAIGTIGAKPLKRFWVFDPDKSGKVKARFKDLLGPGALQGFQYEEITFEESLDFLTKELLV